MSSKTVNEPQFDTITLLARALGQNLFSLSLNARHQEDIETFVLMNVARISERREDRMQHALMLNLEDEVKARARMHASEREQMRQIEHWLRGEIDHFGKHVDPLPAFTGTWLKEFALCATEECEQATPESLLQMANINHQRAAERIIAFHALKALVRKYANSAEPALDSEAQRRESRIFDQLHAMRSVARTKLDRVALLMGGDALTACRLRALADMTRYSVTEYAFQDNRIPGSWSSQLEDSIKAFVAQAAEEIRRPDENSTARLKVR